MASTNSSSSNSNSSTSIWVALVAVAVGSILVLVSPTLLLKHDGSSSSSSSSGTSSSSTASKNTITTATNWEQVTVQHARDFQKRAVIKVVVHQDATTTTTTAMPPPPLQDVVILITGATSGIGKELALWTYKHGATVIAMGRSPTKLQQLQEQAVAAVAMVAGGDGENDTQQQQQQNRRRLHTVLADFTDLASVANAVDIMKEQSLLAGTSSFFPNHIDIVVCNAGIHTGLSGALWDPYQSTKQGHDLTFGVNYLSHFLLTEKLLEQTTLLEASRYPRIVHVTSTFHFAVDGSDLRVIPVKKGGIDDGMGMPPPPIIASRPGGSHGFVSFRSQRQYANSKLAQILHARYYNNRRQKKKSRNNNNNNTIPIPISLTACPAWVGTSIIQADEKSLQARLFKAMAFPANGFGLSSILRAMFVVTTVDGDGDDTETDNDFYVNNKIGTITPYMDRALTVTPWIQTLTYHWLPIRDVVLFASAMVLLHWQRVFPSVVPTKSSIASYDTDLQDELYTWSRQAVQEWL